VTDLFEPALPELEHGLPGPAPGEFVPEPGAAKYAFRALGFRQFRLLFAASSIGDIGYWISFIALQAEMADITDKSASWLGILFFANFIPMLLFSPVAGVAADRIDRKLLLVLIRSVIAVLGATMGALILAGVATPLVLVVMAFLLGTTYGFMGPAQSAAVANTVPRDALMGAVSMASAGNNLCRIAGPALAAPILAIWGTGWAFVVYACTQAAVALLLLPIHLTSRLETSDDVGMWRRWLDGLRHARERPPAVSALVTMCVFSIFGGAQMALYPIIASDVHDKPTRAFTTIVVASGIGAVGGAIGNGFRRTVPRMQTALLWLVAFSLATMGFALAPTWAGCLAFAVVVGFCYFSMTTALNTLLQHLADDEKRGRIMSLFVVTWGGVIPIGAIWMGAATDATSAPAVIAFGACVCLVFAVVQLLRGFATRARVQPSTAPLR
jgi:MFS family permease